MKALGDFPLFAGVDQKIIERLQRSCSFRSFAAKTNIASADEVCGGLWLMFGGRARKMLYTSNGSAIEFGTIETKQHFGEECLGAAWPYDVVAERASLCLYVPRATVLLAMGIPEVAERVLRNVALVTTHNVRRLSDMKEFSAKERARREVIRRIERGERFTHEEIASAVLTTRETVARVASKINGNDGPPPNVRAARELMRRARNGGKFTYKDVAKASNTSRDTVQQVTARLMRNNIIRRISVACRGGATYRTVADAP